jgi:hypothetical protein
MEENRDHTKLAIFALVLALLALGVAITSLVSAPAPVADPSGNLEALRRETADLRAELAKSRQELEARLTELSAKKEAPAPPIAPAAPTAVDQAALRTLVTDQVREALLQMGGNLRWTAANLPQPIKEALAKVAPGVEITRAEQRQQNNQTIFRLKGRWKDEEFDYRITPAGEVLEADMALEVVPANVREAALKAMDGIRLKDATQVLHDGVVAYDFGAYVGNKEYELRISADGKVLRTEAQGNHGHGNRPPDAAPQKPPIAPTQENF